LGNIIPIAPRNFGGKAGLLFISRRIFHKILINIDHTCWGQKSSKEAAAARYIDKILAKHQLIVKLLRILLLQDTYKDGKKAGFNFPGI
jgi:hypothetical protein